MVCYWRGKEWDWKEINKQISLCVWLGGARTQLRVEQLPSMYKVLSLTSCTLEGDELALVVWMRKSPIDSGISSGRYYFRRFRRCGLGKGNTLVTGDGLWEFKVSCVFPGFMLAVEAVNAVSAQLTLSATMPAACFLSSPPWWTLSLWDCKPK